jgi:hypothetical protein
MVQGCEAELRVAGHPIEAKSALLWFPSPISAHTKKIIGNIAFFPSLPPIFVYTHRLCLIN